MDFDGEHCIPASRPAVWAALNHVDILAACVPGCERLEKTAPRTYAATVAVKIGSLAARFAGTLCMEDVEEGRAYTLKGQGQGGVAGFIGGSARVTLEDAGEGTLLRWRAEGEIGGRLAAVGGRLLHGVAAKLAEEFFRRLAEKIVSPPDCI